MQNLFNKWGFPIAALFLFISLNCSQDTSKIKDTYVAEKMYFKAQKLQKNILINPDIANPEDYERVGKAYRAIIEEFYKKEEIPKEVKAIVQRSWLSIAELLLLQKKYDEAVDTYKEIIQKSPSDRELCAVAQYSIASCFEKLGKFDDAIRAYQKVVQDYPPVLSDTLLPNVNILQTPIYIARLYQRKGKTALAEQQYEQARRYYERIALQWPNSPIALVAQQQIAISFGDQGKWQKSAEILNEIIYNYQDTRELIDIMLALGGIYHRQLQRPAQALNIYQRILQKYPQSRDLGKVYLAIGDIYFQRKNYDEARNKYKHVLDNYRHDGSSCIRAQLAIAKSYELENNWNKALNEYQWVVDNYPRSLQALNIPLYIAEYYRSQNEQELVRAAYENAIKRYQQLIQQYSKSTLATVAQDYMARCYMRLEKWEEAIAALRTLEKMKLPVPQKVNTYLTVGSIYEEKLKDEQRAIEVYSSLLEKFPQIPNAELIKLKTRELRESLNRYHEGNKPPVVSEIMATRSLSSSSIEIKWEPNREDDFVCYKLVRSESPGVDLSNAVVAEIFDQDQDFYVDNNLKEGGTYYYRLYVFDKGGLSSSSREVSAKVKAKASLEGVRLQAYSKNWSTVSLSWTPSSGEEFDSYKIYRSRSSGVNLSSQLVKSIFDNSITSFRDTDLTERTTYYYQVYVFSSSGSNWPSNEVQITTPANVPPMSVTLEKPLIVNEATVRLSWTRSKDDDFSMYRIYRSDRSPVSLSGTPVRILSNKSVNYYKDTGLTPGKTYYYKVVVYDKGGLFSESNEVSVKL